MATDLDQKELREDADDKLATKKARIRQRLGQAVERYLQEEGRKESILSEASSHRISLPQAINRWLSQKTGISERRIASGLTPHMSSDFTPDEITSLCAEIKCADLADDYIRLFHPVDAITRGIMSIRLVTPEEVQQREQDALARESGTNTKERTKPKNSPWSITTNNVAGKSQ